MLLEVAQSLAAVAPDDWNRLSGSEYPFLRHEFLLALEETGCVGGSTGWYPCHLLLRDDAGQLVGAMPLYRKTSSQGEFVFDFAWADAYRRAGLHYYPKLVSAVPFTPATSPRFLTGAGQEPALVAGALLAGSTELARKIGASSVHVLFPTTAETGVLATAGFLSRKDCQFHWRNRGYADFDAFLGEFTAEKRKKAKRERRRVAEAGISFLRLTGAEIDAGLWQQLMPLYASSFWRRGREPYLNEAFFTRISTLLPDNVLAIVAMRSGRPVATALCFRSADTLYGRYWGSEGEYHSLHFETCYYQGIEYCIEQGLQSFEPGTQGEHKISRGFVPTETWSAHWLSHPQFAAAIDQYLDRERSHIDEYIDAARDHVPYKKSST
ncbi:MAG: N-acetyltransferase [Gammaproteobacteria bacterium]|nr:N-acetyltransferase [Gammaproteobacteria bacterium]